jgi:hypothetical protein
VETTTARENCPNSNWGGLGLGGINSLGSKEVGLTVSDIPLPAVVKKLFNLFAIAYLSVMLLPLTVIELILLELLLVLLLL